MHQNDRMKGTNEFFGFKCVQRIEVHTSIVDSVDMLAKDISQLIPELVEISFEQPQYFYTQLAGLRVSLLAAATDDAKNRAEMIASSAGGKVRIAAQCQNGRGAGDGSDFARGAGLRHIRYFDDRKRHDDGGHGKLCGGIAPLIRICFIPWS